MPVLLFSVVLHEFAHGWQAMREGDDTAYMLGRLTLNPIPHIDPIGSIMVPLMLALLNSPFLIGWAKPVPVNPRKYRNYRAGDIRVSLAGIVVNIGLSIMATLLLIIVIRAADWLPAMAPSLEVVASMLQYGILINLVLAFFNLIPIPPLDGSHVLYHLLPPQLGMRYRELGRYGMLILMLLLVVGRPIFSLLMAPAWVLYQLAMNVVSLWT
ncbi:MAG TPA: site-2 protease family protein [Longimicrobiales bacterium]|nr:site-2 protease family protein [Longimicrobiales bacterium]